MPKHRKGKGKASARPLAVPSMDNRPRYATPEVCHLPSPTPTPAKHKPSGPQGGTRVKASPQEIEELTDRFEGGLEFNDESEEASSDADSVVLRSGPWVEKGNPTGFLDSEDEELLEQWSEEHREDRFKRMTHEEWEGVAKFLINHAEPFAEQIGGALGMVQAILGEDGSVWSKGRRELSDQFLATFEELQGYRGQQDTDDDKLDKLKREEEMVAFLTQEIQNLKAGPGDLDLQKELLHLKQQVTTLTRRRQVYSGRRMRS